MRFAAGSPYNSDGIMYISFDTYFTGVASRKVDISDGTMGKMRLQWYRHTSIDLSVLSPGLKRLGMDSNTKPKFEILISLYTATNGLLAFLNPLHPTCHRPKTSHCQDPSSRSVDSRREMSAM